MDSDAGLTTVKSGQAARALGLSPAQERKLLSGLARSGQIARVRRGLYLAPGKLPVGGVWTPGREQALNALMDAVDGRCQICGPNAFNRYGFDTQVPARIHAYNNRISGERTIGAVELTLIKVADKRLGATEKIRLRDGQVAVYSSRTRSLIDAVYDWSRFNSLPRGFRWIERELRAKRVTAEDLAKVAIRFGDIGTIRRVGWLMERLGVAKSVLDRLDRSLRPSKGWIPLNPVGLKRGTVSPRWRVVINEME